GAGVARGRLEAHQEEVRALPAAPGDARRPRSRPPLDAERAGGRPQRHGPWGATLREQVGAGRAARSRLRDRQRPVSLQKGLWWAELEPGAALAPHRAGRGREGTGVPAGGARRPAEAADLVVLAVRYNST